MFQQRLRKCKFEHPSPLAEINLQMEIRGSDWQTIRFDRFLKCFKMLMIQNDIPVSLYILCMMFFICYRLHYPIHHGDLDSTGNQHIAASNAVKLACWVPAWLTTATGCSFTVWHVDQRTQTFCVNVHVIKSRIIYPNRVVSLAGLWVARRFYLTMKRSVVAMTPTCG